MVVTGAEAVVVFMKFIDVGGRAACHDGAAVTIIFGTDVEDVSIISCTRRQDTPNYLNRANRGRYPQTKY